MSMSLYRRASIRENRCKRHGPQETWKYTTYMWYAPEIGSRKLDLDTKTGSWNKVFMCVPICQQLSNTWSVGQLNFSSYFEVSAFVHAAHMSIQFIDLFYIKNLYSEEQINGELSEMSLSNILTLWQCRSWHILRYFPSINAPSERMTKHKRYESGLSISEPIYIFFNLHSGGWN
jgi:hypothetical protein